MNANEVAYRRQIVALASIKQFMRSVRSCGKGRARVYNTHRGFCQGCMRKCRDLLWVAYYEDRYAYCTECRKTHRYPIHDDSLAPDQPEETDNGRQTD